MLKTVVMHLRILWWIEYLKAFYNIINVLTVTFDQFNVSMLNQMLIYFQKNPTDSKVLNDIVN